MVDICSEHEVSPVVAVICRRWSSTAGASDNCQGVLSSYITAIEKVGGAVVLVALQRVDNAELVLARCDGLLLAGGEDVVSPNPANKQAPGSTDEIRDEVEKELAVQAIRDGIPVLGICRGMHLVNVACGGTLTNIDEAFADAVRHVNEWRAGEQYVHDVHISPDSILFGVAGGRAKARVNSHHRRCIDQLGEGLVLAARSTDGVIEAIERRGSSYCVGIQWHPECLLDQGDDFALSILSDFVQACRRSRRAPCWSKE